MESLKDIQKIRRENTELMSSHPLLVLVTGKWAQSICLDSFIAVNGRIDRIVPESYDHMERLGADAHTAESSEVTKAFRLLEYHCSISTYEAGQDHAWRLTGVSPMLSDMVILPRLLEERRVEAVMRMFKRALRKSLKDSLILAGGGRYKEDTLEMKPVFLGETREDDTSTPLPEQG